MKVFNKFLSTTSIVTFFMLVIIPSGYSQQKTCVIIHGAWGGSYSFKQVDAILTAKNYNVYRPSLTGLGERVHLSTSEIDLNTHILDVVNTILFEDLHDVTLIGHSYGGMVISGVADSIPERIKQLVYLDAFVPNNGESVITARDDGKTGPESESQNGYVKPSWINENDPLPRNVPQSLKTFTTPVSWKKKKTLELPSTYILTVEEGERPDADFFYFFANRATKRGWKTVIMTADHNPQDTKPFNLVDLLINEVLSK